MTAPIPASLVLVGAGKMGLAMLEGWIDTGLDPETTTVIDPKPSPELQALCAARGIRLNPPPTTLAAPAALVLAIKPQTLTEAGPAANAVVGAATLVLSILAGKTIANIKTSMPKARAMVRAMPNLPASIRRGITAAAASADVSTAQRAMADALLASVGEVVWLDESLIDAVTAVSGSGPAYVFHLAECLAAAGHDAGLPRDVAERLARATVAGAGELLRRSELTPAALREAVTSPGGTTAAALERLMGDRGLKLLLSDAVAAAKRRAMELSG